MKKKLLFLALSDPFWHVKKCKERQKQDEKPSKRRNSTQRQKDYMEIFSSQMKASHRWHCLEELLTQAIILNFSFLQKNTCFSPEALGHRSDEWKHKQDDNWKLGHRGKFSDPVLRWNEFLGLIFCPVGSNPLKDTANHTRYEKICSSSECCRKVRNIINGAQNQIYSGDDEMLKMLNDIRLMLEDKQCRWALEEVSTSTQRKNWRFCFGFDKFSR